MTIDQSALLDERYRLDERIGSGGMADVFRGTDQLLDRRVAIKVLREVSDPAARDRFVVEARTLAALDHPGLITLLDAGIQGERPYLVMTFADDATLSARIAAGPLEPTEVAAIGAQIAGALAYAHDRGVVHRDVKPSNVLLCGDGRSLLADFGIARLIGSTEHHTGTGETIGSPAYLAPEQVAGLPLTPAVDVYALGLVLLEALTGFRAFPGTPVEAAVARLNVDPPIPVGLGPAWRDLLVRMTDRDADGRPGAAEVAEALAALDGEVGFRQAQPPAPTQPPAQAQPAEAVETGLFETLAEQPPAAPRAEETAVLSAALVRDATFAVGYADADRDAESALGPYGVARRRWFWAQIASAVLMFVAVIVVLVLASGGEPAPKTKDVSLPTGVPTKFQQPLTDLHEALNGAAQ